MDKRCEGDVGTNGDGVKVKDKDDSSREPVFDDQGNAISEVDETAGEMWHATGESEKLKHVKEQNRLHDEYDEKVPEYYEKKPAKESDEGSSQTKKGKSSSSSKPSIKSTDSKDGNGGGFKNEQFNSESAPKKKKDPDAPKKPMTAYFLWLTEIRDKIKADNPGITLTEGAKKAGEMWHAMGDSEKSKYVKEQKRLKDEYEEKVREYFENKSASESDKGSPKPIEDKSSSSKPSIKPADSKDGN